MSFVQEILKAVSADLMYEHNYDNLIKGLEAIPESYHELFARAYFGINTDDKSGEESK